jgi:hypothetical protein
MSEAIVVASTPGREGWLKDCLESIGDIEVIVLRQAGTWELGKIKWLYENTTFDRFMFLHDSVIVKDQRFFELAFARPGSVSINNCPSLYGSYMGIYERDILAQVSLYSPVTQRDSIRAEVEWTSHYSRVAGQVTVLFPELHDKNATRFEERHGRKNLVLENEYLIKYKGTWA